MSRMTCNFMVVWPSLSCRFIVVIALKGNLKLEGGSVTDQPIYLCYRGIKIMM